jgi:hypothetical protein
VGADKSGSPRYEEVHVDTLYDSEAETRDYSRKLFNLASEAE